MERVRKGSTSQDLQSCIKQPQGRGIEFAAKERGNLGKKEVWNSSTGVSGKIQKKDE